MEYIILKNKFFIMDIEKLLRIREAILCFFKLHDQDPTPENYRVWLNSLDSFEQEQIRELGFENGRQLITFQSYRLVWTP